MRTSAKSRWASSAVAIGAGTFFTLIATGFSLAVDGSADRQRVTMPEWTLRGTLPPASDVPLLAPRASDRPGKVLLARL